MGSTIKLSMVDGVQVVVPDSLDAITPYVLREQQDWFEDEIKFLRRLLEPGQKAIDIGASYGLYALSIAKVVGPAGHVWAFEPASATARLLEESIAVNRFGNVTLVQSALAEAVGTAQLSERAYSELNALIRGDTGAQSTEAVRVVTLDDYGESSGWQDIDFVKIDAEGEELNILDGGARFFAVHSPLVQYEIKRRQHVHVKLIQAFDGLGYDSYRLVPGLDMLVPFRSDTPIDRYQLNLFACKSDRATRLASGGWLIDDIPGLGTSQELPRCIPHDVFDEHKFDWRSTLAPLPYGKNLAGRWERTVASEDSNVVEESLALYALSRDASRPSVERFCALDCSFRRFASLADESPNQSHLASLARVARDFGARAIAIDALAQLCNGIVRNKRVDLDVPFLAPGARFESLDPDGKFADWMLVAAAEELERLRAFSSFYTGISASDRLETICNSDFAGPEMHRRLSLMRQRFEMPESTSTS